MIIWPRRAGKDIVAWNFCIRKCIEKPCTIFYLFPTYSQARKVIWQSITNEGKRFLDFVPPELLLGTNEQLMQVKFTNGSILQLVGSDNYDALVGTNPYVCVFSEYALQDPRAFQFLRPILVANDGIAIFISTPRGKNHLYELYNVAQNNPHWFVERLTVNDTKHISLFEIEKEKAEGLVSDDLIQQEYYCSFDFGIEGAIYGKYIDKLRLDNRITDVPYEPTSLVHTAWDLGMRDDTCVIFFQICGMTVRIIDAYSNNGKPLEHYAQLLQEKDYVYGKHFAPHDIKVRELGTGLSRLEKARQLGIKFTVAHNLPVVDGIEAVRSALAKIWFDQNKCADLIKSLEHYRREYDHKKQVYKSTPLHDFSSHYSDAMRYLCISLPRTKSGMTQEDVNKMHAKARGGTLPDVFTPVNHY